MMEKLAQEIANELADLAYYVRTEPQDARDHIGNSEAITAKLRELYTLVGEP